MNANFDRFTAEARGREREKKKEVIGKVVSFQAGTLFIWFAEYRSPTESICYLMGNLRTGAVEFFDGGLINTAHTIFIVSQKGFATGNARDN